MATPGTIEIQTLEEFDAAVDSNSDSRRSGRRWYVRAVDLRGRDPQLRALHVAGAVFLGCTFSEATEAWLRSHGAMILAPMTGLPFDPYRGRLYTPEELYAGIETSSYDRTPDARIHAWSRAASVNRDVHGTLASALHDHGMDDALGDVVDQDLDGVPVVGVMGGHALERGEQAYLDATRLGRGLALGGNVVATGGGPGAMEAANAGAYLCDRPEPEATAALVRLGRTPSFRPSVEAWARVAFEVVGDGGRTSLGVPTWFYGHEPPNAFATQIAKYFTNSRREAVLLQICTGGIVFLPGAAGTVQEIFQDACENYYASPSAVAPMILVGVDYWNHTVPAWPLLAALARDRAMEAHVFCVETVDDALALLS